MVWGVTNVIISFAPAGIVPVKVGTRGLDVRQYSAFPNQDAIEKFVPAFANGRKHLSGVLGTNPGFPASA
jgi:hypothetical protein